ncbi:MAG: hypothetical protein ACR2FS_06235 [Phormidesmis sp.]
MLQVLLSLPILKKAAGVYSLAELQSAKKRFIAADMRPLEIPRSDPSGYWRNSSQDRASLK